jgi:hypothetical protein
LIDDLKTLGIEELERRAKEADEHIRALNFDESEEGIRAREELIEAQTLLNEARAELLKDEDLPEEVVVGMEVAYVAPRFARPGESSELEELIGSVFAGATQPQMYKPTSR